MPTSNALAPSHASRRFLPADFVPTSWSTIKPYCDELMDRPLSTLDDLKRWLADRSELDAALAEDLGWRYIRMTCFTDRDDFRAQYQYFVEHIQPELAAQTDQLNRKTASVAKLVALSREPDYAVFLRHLQESIDLFRSENIPLFTQVDTLTQEYNRLVGAMTITHQDKEITLQQASVLLMEADRSLREKIYNKITTRRQQDREALDVLFSRLVEQRCAIAKNADCPTFCDYMFKSYGRFDYTPEDCFQFHDAVAGEVVPYLNRIALERKNKLGVDTLRPWDKSVNVQGLPPLKAFEGEEDLMQKTIQCFTAIDPFLGECLALMRSSGRLDLTSRKGKAAGGYNYPLPDTGIPFIFMNATSTLRDAVTLMHEAGHAVHSLLMRDQPLLDLKSPPTEAAELASMAMELMAMEHWDIFFPDPEDLRRAKQEHLEGILETLPWVALVDAFQHWIYQNPNHTAAERTDNWNRLLATFSDSVTNWSGLEGTRDSLWQKQLHLYEVPFYYIEYGIAQLGAIAIWRNYRQDPKKALRGYLAALKLGNTRSLPALYQAAGIRFDFSRQYIRELIAFVGREFDKL